MNNDEGSKVLGTDLRRYIQYGMLGVINKFIYGIK